MSNESVKKFFNILKYSVNSGIDNGLYFFSKQIVDTIKEESRKPKHGRTYYNLKKNGKKIAKHIASKENHESSAELFGSLNKARKFAVSKNKAVVGVENYIDYSDFIEKTRQDTKRAYEENEALLENIILNEIIVNIERNLK